MICTIYQKNLEAYEFEFERNGRFLEALNLEDITTYAILVIISMYRNWHNPGIDDQPIQLTPPQDGATFIAL